MLNRIKCTTARSFDIYVRSPRYSDVCKIFIARNTYTRNEWLRKVDSEFQRPRRGCKTIMVEGVELQRAKEILNSIKHTPSEFMMLRTGYYV